MKPAIVSVLAFASMSLIPAPDGSAAPVCLSAAEIAQTGRVISVMAIGGALRHCAECLGPDRYGQVTADYEGAGLMRDFRTAQDAITTRERYEYSDGIARDMARSYSEKLSADCDACANLAGKLKSLRTPEAREAFYEPQAAELRKTARQCP